MKDWNVDDTFCNGFLLLCVNGDIYPKEIVTATLRCEMETLKQKLGNLMTDKRLYALPPQQAFAEMYDITFPEDIERGNNGCFDITPSSLSDRGCFVFAVCGEGNVRILASKLEYDIENARHRLRDIQVSEACITKFELDEMVSGLESHSMF